MFMSDGSQSNATQEVPRFAMRGNYIKDVSLENPRAPQSLLPTEKAPTISMNMDLQARKLQDNLFELDMTFHVKTEAEFPLFVIELVYSGIFELSGIPENIIERVLLVDSAFSLFPFARRVVADLTRDAGFQPLLLDPIDFLGLFEKRSAESHVAA
jgi:preprotein translocase subunit SecB